MTTLDHLLLNFKKSQMEYETAVEMFLCFGTNFTPVVYSLEAMDGDADKCLTEHENDHRNVQIGAILPIFEMIHAAKLYLIARDQGMNAAMLWKLSN